MKSDTENLRISPISNFIFIVLLLFSIHFWELKYIPQKINAENLITWLVCGFSLFMVIQKDNLRFKYAILLFVTGLLLNCYASYRNMEQSAKFSILSYSYYYFILLYFLMHYLKITRKYLENTIIVFALFYSLIFIIQYKVFPYEIFSRWVKTASEEMQFEIVGHGFLMLGFFLVLNRFLLNKKLIYIFLTAGFFIVLFKCGFRSLIAGAAISAILMGIRLIKLDIKDITVGLVAVLMFAAVTQYGSVKSIINKMINKTESESKLGSKYIRMVETDFFYKKYPRDLSYYIIGGGKPAGKINIENFNPYAIGMNYNIVWVDIGLLGFYIVVGGIATLGLIWYTLKAVFTRLPRDRIYLNSYFLYLLIVSFTNEEIFRDGIFAVQAIGLYLIDITLDEKTSLEVKNKIIETLIS